MTTNECLPTIMHCGPITKDKTFLPSSQSRFDKVLELYTLGLAKPIIFSSGSVYRGIVQEDGWEEMIELSPFKDYVEFIKNWFIEQGVDPKDIITLKMGLESVGETYYTKKFRQRFFLWGFLER